MGKNFYNDVVTADIIGYLFDVEVVIADQVIAVVHVRADNFTEAKEMVYRCIVTRPAERLIPSIQLTPQNA